MSNSFFEPDFGPVGKALKLQKSENIYPYTLARLADRGGDLSKRWYVSFYIWDEKLQAKTRKRIYDVNDFNTDKERRQLADQIIKEINDFLKAGYIMAAEKLVLPATLNLQARPITEIVKLHIENHKKSLSTATVKDYNTLLNTLTAWLKENQIESIRLHEFTLPVANAFFLYLQNEKPKPLKKGQTEPEKGVSSKTYNNYLGYFQRIYNDLVDKETIRPDQNILTKIKQKRVKSGKHIPYTGDQLQKIESEMIRSGKDQLLLFVKFIYYTFARPRRELRFLKVGDIKPDVIYIPAATAKGDGRYISIPDDLNDLIDKYGIRNYPTDFYVFSTSGKPGPVATSKESFYEQNKTILKRLGYIDQDYTLYGYKHTGNIHFYLATKDLKAVQEQNGHTTASQTEKYLRNLGLLRSEKATKNFPKFGTTENQNKEPGE